MTRSYTAVGVAVPGLLLAGFGLVHPLFLAASTAPAWWQLHVPLIPLFPLLAVAMVVVLRGENGALAWGARIGAYGFACLYTGLDVLAGIGAGLTFDVQGDGPAVGALIGLGDRLGHTVIWCLVVATVLAGAVLVRRDGARALPGTLVLLAAAYPFYNFHIFSPYGVLAMAGYAAGFALLAVARRPVVAAMPEPTPVTAG
jgi:hypothetical protein